VGLRQTSGPVIEKPAMQIIDSVRLIFDQAKSGASRSRIYA